jgi:hypothetical protein
MGKHKRPCKQIRFNPELRSFAPLTERIYVTETEKTGGGIAI